MYMIEITEDKMDKLSEHIEKSLKHMGKAMQCVDEWLEEGGMGERGGYGNRQGGGRYGNRSNEMVYRENYGNRGGYGNRMNYRDEEDEWDDDEMGERRRRNRRTGRYM